MPAPVDHQPKRTRSALHIGHVFDSAAGKLPGELLTCVHRFAVADGHVLFRCDGRYRSKLGVSPRRARDVLGSYDPDARLLTIVKFNLPEAPAELPYVNSLWEIQDEPFAGDVVNSYNDGEETPGAGQLGPFYEIETSSPAAELAPEQAVTHVHQTFHLTGDLGPLNAISRAVLGVDLESIPLPQRE